LGFILVVGGFLRSSTYYPVVVNPIFSHSVPQQIVVVFYLLTGRCEPSFLPFVESTLVLILVDDGYFSVVFYLRTGRCNPLFAVIIIQISVLIVLFLFG
jgi:hypothetical protein